MIVTQETPPRELPRLFKVDLIKAIREGQKTETRQPIKPQPGVVSVASEVAVFMKQLADTCPIGRVGDRLWVKETIYGQHAHKIGKDAPKNWNSSKSIYDLGNYWYAADDVDPNEEWTTYTSAIHCPRWAARLILEITEVRVERLQSLSESDVVAEGLVAIYERNKLSVPGEGKLVAEMYRGQFAKLWNGIYPEYSWEKNPFVWVQKFKVVSGGAVPCT